MKTQSMIPKILHQIWIGPREMPIDWMETWRIKNPIMQYILWTEKEISGLKLKNNDKYNYYLERGEYHGVADILRVEVLEKFGGVYIDTDSICIEPIENEIFMRSDFFAVLEYENRIANGIIGAIPNHPIMTDYVRRIKELDISGAPPWRTIGGRMLTKCIKNYGIDKNVTILPTCSFLPRNQRGKYASIVGKIYAEHMWGTTRNLYK